MLPAARVESDSRNERRVNEFIFVFLTWMRNGFYDGWRLTQSVSNERDLGGVSSNGHGEILAPRFLVSGWRRQVVVRMSL
jgi:hypothetical protein